MSKDLLDRPLVVGDYVVFHNVIYEVLELLNNYAKIILMHKSKTTRPVKKYTKLLCIIDKQDVLVWKLKSGI